MGRKRSLSRKMAKLDCASSSKEVDQRSCCCQGRAAGQETFDNLASYLVSAGYRIIRPEPRGFGESVGPVEGVTLRDNARDVAVAIEKTSAAPAIVAGFAWGNRVARMLAV